MSGYLSIKTPCHESWSGMHLSEKGKFCFSCKKDVYDFEHSDIETVKTIYEVNNGDMCGRVPAKLLKDQFEDHQLRRLHSGTVRRFFFAVLFCFGASLFTIDAAKASTVYKLKLSFLRDAGITDSMKVTGVIKDADSKETIAFASVFILADDKVIASTHTDADGKYSVKISKKYPKVDVKASYVGYKDNVVKGKVVAVLKQSVMNVNFGMKYESEMLMGDVEYVPEIGN
ncbi:MAG: carboxypeptidase-like regulatory domain-containing protein [Bacteroidia bacterium]